MGSFTLKDGRLFSQANLNLSHHLSTEVVSHQYQCDCACEGGLGTASSVLLLDRNLITDSQLHRLKPQPYPELYRFEIGQNIGLYNPQASAGVVVLDRVLAKVWQLVEQGLNLAEILSEIQQLDSSATLSELQEIISQFESHKLVYLSPDAPELEIGPSTSLSVWLHISNQCNLRCTYCYLGKTSETMSLETGKEVIANLVESAQMQGVKQLTLKFAGGEALLEWQLVLELYQYAQVMAAPLGIAVQPIILSNGTTITASVAQRLKEYGFYVAISLDGLERDNNLQRPFVNGRGSFQAVERGMLLLKEYEVPFNVSIVVTAQNLAGLPNLFKYLLNHNVPFNLNFFRDNPLAEDGLSVDNPVLIEGLRRAYFAIEQDLPNFSLLNSLLDRVQLESPHRHACGAGVNYVVVKHTGEISTCQMLLHQPVAKAGTKDLLQVVRNADLKNVPSDQKEGCSSCQWRYVCAGGCPIVTHRVFNRYDTRSPFCSAYKALIPEVLRLEALRLMKAN